jgi:hypothetical protein
VDAQVQILTFEHCQLLQEVVQRGELGAFDELLLQVEERSLDLALRPGTVRLTRGRSDAIVAAQLQELRVPAEVRWVGVQYEGFGVIDQELLGSAAEVPQAAFDRFVD